MGFLDRSKLGRAKGKLDQALDQHGDKITGGIDKAAGAADRRTGGRHADKIARARVRAKDALARRRGGGNGVR